MRIKQVNFSHKSQTQIMQSCVHKQKSVDNNKRVFTEQEIHSQLELVLRRTDSYYVNPSERFELTVIRLITKYTGIVDSSEKQSIFIKSADYRKYQILKALIGREYKLFDDFYVTIKMPPLNEEYTLVWEKMFELETE